MSEIDSGKGMPTITVRYLNGHWYAADLPCISADKPAISSIGPCIRTKMRYSPTKNSSGDQSDVQR